VDQRHDALIDRQAGAAAEDHHRDQEARDRADDELGRGDAQVRSHRAEQRPPG
jgi:hypothetical protein